MKLEKILNEIQFGIKDSYLEFYDKDYYYFNININNKFNTVNDINKFRQLLKTEGLPYLNLGESYNEYIYEVLDDVISMNTNSQKIKKLHIYSSVVSWDEKQNYLGTISIDNCHFFLDENQILRFKIIE